MTPPSLLPSLLRAAVLLAALAPGSALAERYRVDLILFADRSAPGTEAPQPVLQPDTVRSFEPWEVMPLRNAGIEVLEDELFGLMNEWKRLSNSRNHEPLVRIAWIQKDPPAERGIALRLRHGKPVATLTPGGSIEVYPVDGWVALMAGRYLHLDANFVQTQRVVTETQPDGELRSLPLRERRRLKRDELNHIDSPGLGVLVKVQRADPKPLATPAPAKPPAPKPATPKKN